MLYCDIGYFCISFILVFVVLGLVFNYVCDINFNYIVECVEVEVSLIFQVSDVEINVYLFNVFNFDMFVKVSYWEFLFCYKLFLE